MKSEFKNFDKTMRQLITVPHETVRAKLEAEKKAKTKKRKTKKSSAGDRASADKD